MTTVATPTLAESTLTCFAQKREEAKQALTHLEYPTTRVEAWKYTRVGKLTKQTFKESDGTEQVNLDAHRLEGAVHLVFVNGNFRSDLSDDLSGIAGLTFKTLAEAGEADVLPSQRAFHQEDIFEAQHVLYTKDGVCLNIDKGASIAQPLHVIHLSAGQDTVSHMQLMVQAGTGSKASIVQTFASEGSNCFVHASAQFNVAANARLDYHKIQDEGTSNFLINREEVHQAEGSHFRTSVSSVQGGWIRNDLHIAVNGEQCTTDLFGLYPTRGEQHVDNHTVVDHKKAHCVSNELYKGVLDDKSTGVFNGKVFVREDSQKINAFQSNGNVLISDTASMNSKPELEIYADDVRCSHGSTTGQLDEEAIFYLRARGLDTKQAKALLLTAFIGEVVDQFETELVEERVKALITKHLGWEWTI